MFKIFYSDGTVSDSVTEARGVQAIVQNHEEVGAEVVSTSDYYVLDGGRWRGVDIFGLFDFLLDSGIVLFGRTIRREEYQAVMREAKAVKETWLPRERKFD